MTNSELADLLEDAALLIHESARSLRESSVIPGTDKWDGIKEIDQYSIEVKMAFKLYQEIKRLREAEKEGER